MIDLGQTVRFVPYWNISGIDTKEERTKKEVKGKVIFVNRNHKQFTVKYSSRGGAEMKETFKFSQIGKDVYVVRGGRYGR